MASSLVADYGSSEDGSSEVEDNNKDEQESQIPITSVQLDNHQQTDFFTASLSDDSDADESRETVTTENIDVTKRLPNPLSGLPVEEDDDCRSSVFTNYFHRAEEAKLAVLERHVKLTTAEVGDGMGDIRKRKKYGKRGLCVNFQQGHCRYGDRCRFAHTVETDTQEVGHIDENISSDLPTSFSGRTSSRFSRSSFVGPGDTVPSDDEDNSNAQKKRKLRSGITDSLVPPKKALKTLGKQREQERPWTVSSP